MCYVMRKLKFRKAEHRKTVRDKGHGLINFHGRIKGSRTDWKAKDCTDGEELSPVLISVEGS